MGPPDQGRGASGTGMAARHDLSHLVLSLSMLCAEFINVGSVVQRVVCMRYVRTREPCGFEHPRHLLLTLPSSFHITETERGHVTAATLCGTDRCANVFTTTCMARTGGSVCVCVFHGFMNLQSRAPNRNTICCMKGLHNAVF